MRHAKAKGSGSFSTAQTSVQGASADPHCALYGGSADGTQIPSKIIRRALTLLRPGGLLLMEHSPSQAAVLREHATRVGMVDVSTAPDMTGRLRFLRARAPQ